MSATDAPYTPSSKLSERCTRIGPSRAINATAASNAGVLQAESLRRSNVRNREPFEGRLARCIESRLRRRGAYWHYSSRSEVSGAARERLNVTMAPIATATAVTEPTVNRYAHGTEIVDGGGSKTSV